MKTIKKLLALLAALLLFVCTLGGCTSDTASDKVDNDKKESIESEKDEQNINEQTEIEEEKVETEEEKQQRLHDELRNEFDALPDPSTLTTTEDSVKYLEKYSELYSRATDLLLEYPENQEIQTVYNDIDSAMISWLETNEQFLQSEGNSEEASEYWDRSTKCIKILTEALQKKVDSQQ